MNILEVKKLTVTFPRIRNGVCKPHEHFKVVDDVSFSIPHGETLGLVGESGCGKTTIARCITRLQKTTFGRICFDGIDITELPDRELRTKRHQFQMVFQDYQGSLNPRMKIGEILAEAFEATGISGLKSRHEQVRRSLDAVGLDPQIASRFPHELSGGQQQRVCIARALTVQPKLIIYDEPVSALDVSVQAQVINLLLDQQKQRGLSYLFITHDLALVQFIASRVMVMFKGKIVETGDSRAIVRNPKHPYTQTLIASIPSLDSKGLNCSVISQQITDPVDNGCPFFSRCPFAEMQCQHVSPGLSAVGENHFVACHQLDKENGSI